MLHNGQEPSTVMTSPSTHPALSRRPLPRAAFTLVEIMMAIGILTVGTAAVVSQMVSLHSNRMWTDDVSDGRYVMDYMIHSLQAMNWDDLNDRTKPEAYLFWARVPDADGVDNDDYSLGDDLNLPLVAGSQDPTQVRRLPFKTRADGLRVYVEYFRAVTAVDSSGAVLADSANGNAPCSGGLLENPFVAGSNTTLDTTRTLGTANGALAGLSILAKTGGRNVLPALTANGGVAPVLLPAAETVASQVNTRIAEHDPVAVRITVTWIDRASTPGASPNRLVMTTITGKAR